MKMLLFMCSENYLDYLQYSYENDQNITFLGADSSQFENIQRYQPGK